jgi:hypothetical protein
VKELVIDAAQIAEVNVVDYKINLAGFSFVPL